MLETRPQYLLSQLRASFWFVPSLLAVAALGLALAMLRIDASLDLRGLGVLRWLYAGDADGARQLLVVIGGSMLTVAGVAFSVTMVALSMASAQFGPKLLRNYMRDRGNQVVLGTFVGDFIYCLVVLRYVRGGDATTFVPHLSVNLGIVLALASVGVLIYFFHHVSASIQADNVIAILGEELDEVIEGWVEDGDDHGPPRNGDPRSLRDVAGEPGSVVVTSPRDGYVQSINHSALVEVAARHDVCIALERRAGHFVVRGGPLAAYAPAREDHDDLAAGVADAFIFGRQRSALQDPEHIIEQLGQVGARALSPSLNDPYTAVACVDWLGAALVRIAGRDLPPQRRCDSEGTLRLLTVALTFEGIIDTAFDELRQSARPSTAVTIRLLEAIETIATFTDKEAHLAALQRQAEMIAAGSRDALPEPGDRRDVDRRHRKLLRTIAERRRERSAQSA